MLSGFFAFDCWLCFATFIVTEEQSFYTTTLPHFKLHCFNILFYNCSICCLTNFVLLICFFPLYFCCCHQKVTYASPCPVMSYRQYHGVYLQQGCAALTVSTQMVQQASTHGRFTAWGAHHPPPFLPLSHSFSLCQRLSLFLSVLCTCCPCL